MSSHEMSNLVSLDLEEDEIKKNESKTHKKQATERSTLTKEGMKPPPAISLTWKQKVRNALTFGNLKTFLTIVVALIAAIVLASEPEMDETLNLASVSTTQVFVEEITHTPSTMIGIDMILPPLTNVVVFVKIEGFSIDTNQIENITLKSYVTSETEQREIKEIIDIEGTDLSRFTFFRFFVFSETVESIPLSFDGKFLPEMVRYEVIFASLILVALYILIIFELFHRTVCAMVAAFVALATLSQLHDRPSFETIVSWIDYETIGLLFGMMIIVGIFSGTGFFEWAAIKSYKLSKGNLWRLTVILCIFTAVISAFLDNVTTILLLTPVTIKLCKVLNINPITMLLAEVIASNIGGTGTIIGDPPNIIIANHPAVKEAIGFIDFSLHMMPGVIISMVVVLLFIWKFYSKSLKPDRTASLRSELLIWKKTLLKYSTQQEDIQELRSKIETYISDLSHRIEEIENQDEPEIVESKSISELEEVYKIKDWPLFINSCFVILGVIILFFTRTMVGLQLSLAWIAIIGAMVHIIVSGITHIEEILNKVEFGTLMFFAALFILMRCLEELGLIHWIAHILEQLIRSVPEGDLRLWVSILLLIWVSAFVSAFIDNIPYMATLAPVVVHLSESGLGLPLTPLVWAICYGTCFGGNGTIIGASANVVAVGLAEQSGYHIGFKDFFKIGMPCMIISTFVITIYLSIFHVLIPWY